MILMIAEHFVVRFSSGAYKQVCGTLNNCLKSKIYNQPLKIQDLFPISPQQQAGSKLKVRLVYNSSS